MSYRGSRLALLLLLSSSQKKELRNCKFSVLLLLLPPTQPYGELLSIYLDLSKYLERVSHHEKQMILIAAIVVVDSLPDSVCIFCPCLITLHILGVYGK